MTSFNGNLCSPFLLQPMNELPPSVSTLPPVLLALHVLPPLPGKAPVFLVPAALVLCLAPPAERLE